MSSRQSRVLRWLKKRKVDYRWMQKLAWHKTRLHKEIGGGFRYVPKEEGAAAIPLRGLTTVMEARLFHHGGGDTVAAPRAPPIVNGISSQGPLRHYTGHKRGTLIHKQLEDKVNLDRASYRRVHPHGSHAWVRLLRNERRARGYRQFRGEFLVYHMGVKLATPIDALLSDKKGRIIVDEVKSGYRGTFTVPDGHVWTIPALAHFFPVCTVHARAVIQVVLGAEMLRQRWGIPYERLRPCVTRVDDEMTEFFFVPRQVFRELGPLLLELVAPPQPSTHPW